MGGKSTLFNLPACFRCVQTRIRPTAERTTTLPGLKKFQRVQIIPLSCLRRNNRRGERDGRVQWGEGWGALPGVCRVPPQFSLRSATSLLPLPEQSLPSCEPDLVTWLAAWGHCHATPSFRALRLRARTRLAPPLVHAAKSLSSTAIGSSWD